MNDCFGDAFETCRTTPASVVSQQLSHHPRRAAPPETSTAVAVWAIPPCSKATSQVSPSCPAVMNRRIGNGSITASPALNG